MTVLVLGIGNILWADEGFGVRAVEAFHYRYELPDGVVLLDGGTQGLYLVNYVQEADDLLVFDAIDYGLTPGALKMVRDEEVPKFTGAKKMSLHQTGFQEVLSAADLLGAYPSRLALIGCQPVDLEDWGGPLTAPVRDAIGPAVEAAVAVLAEWGVRVRPRPKPLDEDAGLLTNDIGHAAYERLVAEPPLQHVMAGAGPPSTPLPTAARQGVDGGPAPAMTVTADALTVGAA